MTETEYETKRKFVEEQLAVLVNSIDPRILALKYKKTDEFEWVIAHYPSDAVQINVTGDSTLYIAIDVMTALFGHDSDEAKQQELRQRVNHIESACAQLTESAVKLIGEIADVTTAILQSTAQNDSREEDKPDET